MEIKQLIKEGLYAQIFEEKREGEVLALHKDVFGFGALKSRCKTCVDSLIDNLYKFFRNEKNPFGFHANGLYQSETPYTDAHGNETTLWTVNNITPDASIHLGREIYELFGEDILNVRFSEAGNLLAIFEAESETPETEGKVKPMRKNGKKANEGIAAELPELELVTPETVE